ncbi:MAG: NAD-binding protein [Solirubrobacteraceae bacterium]|jgi:voltage-gated potassium channel
MPEPRTAARRRISLSPEFRSRTEMRAFLRRLALLGCLIASLLVLGALAYALMAGTSFAYGLVWAVDTVTTVGAIGEPTSTAARALKAVIEILGIGTLLYSLVTVAEFFVAGHLGELLIAKRTQKMIDSLTGHYIVCGYGRVGRQVVRDLQAAGAQYVIVDSNPAVRELAQRDGLPFIAGDASSDAVLIQAGVQRACSILACADSDSDNVFITLTARELRADIAILARAGIEDSEKKLKRAGADRVISPYKASGTEMARLALHPQISGVVDVDSEYRVEEIVVGDGYATAPQTVGDIHGGAVIVGLRRGGEFQAQPPADTVLQPGDVIIAIGTSTALELLEMLFAAADKQRSAAATAASSRRWSTRTGRERRRS